MKLTIESTDQLTTMDRMPVRVWKGVTESGIECFVFVHRVAVRNDADCNQFDAELNKQLPPGRHSDLRKIL